MIMDYKNKYEQALERARIWKDKSGMSEDKQGILDDIFPELAEPDDERIRKELIEFVKSRLAGFPQCEKYIAWLEKQSKKKSIDDLTQQEAMDIAVAKCFNEQKHIDKVEPKFKIGDKIYLKPEYRMPDDDTPIANTVKEIIGIDDEHYRFYGSYIFIEDQDKYELVEQKPTDEEMKELLQTEYEKGRADAIAEEKERILEKLEEWLDEYISNLADVGTDTLIGSFRKYLDGKLSVKPQNRWKPTEEQMVAIDTAINVLGKGTLNGKQLIELQKALKKLKE